VKSSNPENPDSDKKSKGFWAAKILEVEFKLEELPQESFKIEK